MTPHDDAEYCRKVNASLDKLRRGLFQVESGDGGEAITHDALVLLKRFPAGAYLKRVSDYLWAVRWPYRGSGTTTNRVEKDKNPLVALQRAVRRMENE